MSIPVRFDGWLLNCEKPFSEDVWNPEILESFLLSLKVEMGDAGELIWQVNSWWIAHLPNEVSGTTRSRTTTRLHIKMP